MITLTPGINLSGQTLNGEIFSGDGTGAHLLKITAQNAIFDDTTLIDANLGEADLFGASFVRVNLSGADLALVKAQQSNFIKAILVDAKLDSANFSSEQSERTKFVGADLTRATATFADK